MKKVTEADFEKVRKYVSIMAVPYQAPDYEKQYEAKQQAYEEAKPAATFLIHYYFTVVKPDNGEKSIVAQGERPYGSTLTERVIIAFNNGIDNYGNFGEHFIEKYPTLLEEAIVRYKREANERLEVAVKQPLSVMTGGQLLLILQEHDRRSTEGYPLMMPSDEDGQIYKNPYTLLASVDQLRKADAHEPEHTGGV